MNGSGVDKKLVKILKSYNYLIAYSLLSDEIDYKIIDIFNRKFKSRILLPNQSRANVDYWVEHCISVCQSNKVCLLIPGRNFDIRGTRHGRGGGWYDQFLSRLPVSWLRIGITNEDHFSNCLLKRQLWDQPVDWLVVRKKDNSSLVIESRARF